MIQLDNSILDEALYFGERFDRHHALIDLQMLASVEVHTEHRRSIYFEVGIGEVAISVHELAERWQWCDKSVRTYLKNLETLGHIEVRRNKVVSIIKVLGVIGKSKAKVRKSNLSCHFSNHSCVVRQADLWLDEPQESSNELPTNGQTENIASEPINTGDAEVANNNGYLQMGKQNAVQEVVVGGVSKEKEKEKEKFPPHPLYKEKEKEKEKFEEEENAHEQKFSGTEKTETEPSQIIFIRDLKADAYFGSTWSETFQMRYKIKQEQLLQLLDEFANECICRGQNDENLQGVKYHFTNWYTKKQEINASRNERKGSENTRGVADRMEQSRRGCYETTAKSAADYIDEWI
jgi:hypothetical protein